MKINDEEIDAALKDSHERLRTLEQRMRDKDPTLDPMAGYYAHMGRKYNNRLGALKDDREMQAHRYFSHADRDGVQVIMCSCGGEIPGDIREMGDRAFLVAEGHIPFEGD